jgi:CheY-like chemotaxis protein
MGALDILHDGPSADEARGRLNILLVDDTHAERVLLEAFLRQQGHNVRTAEHGAQALEVFDENEIDLVLMDVIMPVLDGIEATQRLKARCRQRWVPVILVSTLSSEADETRALEAGADDYLFKPISLAVLGAKLRSFLRIAQTTRSLAHHRRAAQAETELASTMIERLSRRQDGLRDPALSWVVRASNRFSGDVVAAARTPSGSLVAMLADATGHGLPAAISLLPMLQVFYGMARKDLHVGDVASEMNRRLKEYAPVGIYLAAALVAVHPHTGQVEVWNGGMPAGLWLRGGEVDAPRALASQHLPLGILDDAEFDASCVTTELRLGGRLVFFSDGVTEASSPQGEPFGVARLRAQLQGGDPEHAVARALGAVEAHLDGRPAHDDISMLIIALG